MVTLGHINSKRPWNRGKLTGQKPPLKLKEIWTIRIRLQIAQQIRDLALFNLSIDSKLRSCDPVKIRVRDVTHGANVSRRAKVMQQKTGQPIQFEITEQTRDSIGNWVRDIGLELGEYGTHSLRRTKVSLIGRRTKNLRAVQLLPGHTKMESTVRYLGIEIEDALEMVEQTDI